MELKAIIEAIVFSSPEPVSVERLFKLLKDYNKKEIEKALAHISNEYKSKDRGIELVETKNGWRFQTKKELKDWISSIVDGAPIRLSNAALEVLAILLCKEPATRAQIEAIRGIESSYILKQLLELGLINIVGRKEVIGRPLLYALSPKFWDTFSIKDKDEFLKLIQENLSQDELEILKGLGGGS